MPSWFSCSSNAPTRDPFHRPVETPEPAAGRPFPRRTRRHSRALTQMDSLLHVITEPTQGESESSDHLLPRPRAAPALPANIRAAIHSQTGNSKCRARPPEEQIVEEVDGIRDVHLSISVDIEDHEVPSGLRRRPAAGHRIAGSQEQDDQRPDGIAQVEASVLRGVSGPLPAPLRRLALEEAGRAVEVRARAPALREIPAVPRRQGIHNDEGAMYRLAPG